MALLPSLAKRGNNFQSGKNKNKQKRDLEMKIGIMVAKAAHDN